MSAYHSVSLTRGVCAIGVVGVVALGTPQPQEAQNQCEQAEFVSGEVQNEK